MALTEEGIIDIPGQISRWVMLPGGVKAHYVTSGQSGPAVVLLHGGIQGSSGTAGWRYMAPFLGENGFTVFCPDQPAFGLTEDPDYYYTPGPIAHRDFLHDFTTALGLKRFHLAGNSMGCKNTVIYACTHPERVISYACIAGDVGDVVPMEELRKLDKRPASEKVSYSADYDGTKESMRQMMERIIYRPEAITDDLITMRVAAANRHKEALELGGYAGSGAKFDENYLAAISTKGRLDRLTIPSIHLHGRQDIMQPLEWGYAREDALPHTQFFYPDECGHQGQSDQPEMHNQIFLEFFRDGKISRKTAEWAGISTRRPEIPGLIVD
jgi:pimeloyl-ACP methyl ester carboxylesterase